MIIIQKTSKTTIRTEESAERYFKTSSSPNCLGDELVCYMNGFIMLAIVIPAYQQTISEFFLRKFCKFGGFH